MPFMSILSAPTAMGIKKLDIISNDYSKIMGLSIIVIVIFAGVVLNLVGWAETSIGDLVYQFQTLFQNLFFTG